MIRKIARFLVGFLLASVAWFVIVYLFGLGLEKMGIELFASEADQQRNFNIVFGAWLLLAVVGGIFLMRTKR